MKDAIVAKVAAQAADFYQEALRNTTNYEVKGFWDKVGQLVSSILGLDSTVDHTKVLHRKTLLNYFVITSILFSFPSLLLQCHVQGLPTWNIGFLHSILQRIESRFVIFKNFVLHLSKNFNT